MLAEFIKPYSITTNNSLMSTDHYVANSVGLVKLSILNYTNVSLHKLFDDTKRENALFGAVFNHENGKFLESTNLQHELKKLNLKQLHEFLWMLSPFIIPPMEKRMICLIKAIREDINNMLLPHYNLINVNIELTNENENLTKENEALVCEIKHCNTSCTELQNSNTELAIKNEELTKENKKLDIDCGQFKKQLHTINDILGK